MNSSDIEQFWDPSQLTSKERDIRDRFVAEYVIDYDAKRAALRVGYTESFAETYSQKFLNEAYVQQKIKKFELDEAEDDKGEADSDRRRIRAGLMREAHYRGPGSSHAARVAALAQLAKIRDMEASKKLEVKSLGGVMVMPGIASMGDWQNVASSQQADLQESTLKPVTK